MCLTSEKHSFDFSLKVIELAAANLEQEAADLPCKPAVLEAIAGLEEAVRSIRFAADHNPSRSRSGLLSGHGTAPSNTVVMMRDALDEGCPETMTTSTISPPDGVAVVHVASEESRGLHSRSQSIASGMADLAIHTAETHLQHTRRVAAAFHIADIDKNGSVGLFELRHYLRSIGVPRKTVKELLKRVDVNKDGIVSVDEIVAQLEDPQYQEVVERMEAAWEEGRVIDPPSDRCMLRHSSHARQVWDAIIFVVLVITCVLVPLTLGFDAIANWARVTNLELSIDCIFLLDVVLNFRTGIYTKDGFEILRGKKVACIYLRTWFFIDLVSALPFGDIDFGGDVGPTTTALRLLKSERMLRSMKLLRLARLVRTDKYAAVWDRIEEFSHSTKALTHLTLFKLMLAMLLLCHWLGCLLAWSAGGCVEMCEIEEERNSLQRQYMGSLYWAFTTVTTVGYGDISPSDNAGRLCAILAMVIGGAFYGFVIGHITSVVSAQGLSERLYYDRMSEVQAWLDFHHFPRTLKRRVRMYFSQHLRHTPPPDEVELISQLSPELQSAVGDLMVSREVRMNPMLQGVPTGVMRRLILSIQPVTVEKAERVVASSELGYAMFVVTEGQLVKRFEENGVQFEVPLELGDSFGEEVLCGEEARYNYEVVAKTRCSLQSIPCAGIAREVPNVPILMDVLKRNYHHLLKEADKSTASNHLKMQYQPSASGHLKMQCLRSKTLRQA